MKGMELGYIIMTNGRRSSSLGDVAGSMCRGGGLLGGRWGFIYASSVASSDEWRCQAG